jgi:glycosyltransferase involved in cell wall biosynthesis
MSDQYTFTVFTPSFNRAHTLPRVYASLESQTFRDFEWLVVDDGSNDATRELVEQWQTPASFPIRYLYQENQGKHVAFNKGVREAQGRFFLTLDSDDACVPQALERLKYHWDSIPGDQKERFSAVTVLCQDQTGKLVGDPFPRDILDSDSIEFTFKYKIRGDKWGFQRTEVLREFPFPVFTDTKFISESTVWLALSRRFQTRFVNEILYVCHLDGEAKHHLSSLTPGTIRGRALFHRQVLNDFADLLPRYPWGLLRSAINFSRYSFGIGRRLGAQFEEVRPLRSRLLLAASLPISFLMALRDHHVRPANSP